MTGTKQHDDVPTLLRVLAVVNSKLREAGQNLVHAHSLSNIPQGYKTECMLLQQQLNRLLESLEFKTRWIAEREGRP